MLAGIHVNSVGELIELLGDCDDTVVRCPRRARNTNANCAVKAMYLGSKLVRDVMTVYRKIELLALKGDLRVFPNKRSVQ